MVAPFRAEYAIVPISSPTHTKEAENDLFYINGSQQKIGELNQNNKMDFKFQGLDKTKQTGSKQQETKTIIIYMLIFCCQNIGSKFFKTEDIGGSK